jgi:hypothetical protein
MSPRLVAEWWELYSDDGQVGEPRFASRDLARAWRARAGVRARLVRVRRWRATRPPLSAGRTMRTQDGLVTIWR